MSNLYFDRDLSWLSFNNRILIEAKNENIPLLERLKFIAIFSSNLDEFFRVRVASIQHLVKIDKQKIDSQLDFKPAALLQKIREEVNNQLPEYGKTLNQILDALATRGISFCKKINKLTKKNQSELSHYFKTNVMAYLKTQKIGEGKSFLNNRQLYFAIRLKDDSEEKSIILNIPSDRIGRFYKLTDKDSVVFVYIDDIIREHLHMIFPGHEVLECKSIKLNKDADLHIEDEFSGDLVSKIEKQINKRNLGMPSMFLYDESISNTLLGHLETEYNLENTDLLPGGKYHNLSDYFQISNLGNELEYEKWTPKRLQKVEKGNSIFECIENSDIILHFPYQSYDYILQFFNQAAIDPHVTNINVTFYRMAEKSLIGDALISAASNGKKVSVFIEVKARFDEANNLIWADRMREAGIKIIYSMPGLKVHAKVALIKRKNSDGKSQYYGFFGTGNLNESTAKIYSDHGLLTNNEEMTDELARVFKYLHNRQDPGQFEHLIVSQFGALEQFSALIDREIKNAAKGKKGKLIIKLNNLQETSLIDKIYEAASKSVEVTLIVRGICCLVPRPGIKVIRIVDRYLEHARIFYFWNDGAEDVRLGSSDWMNRNLHRRIEVTFPIYDNGLKQQIIDILNIQLTEDAKSVQLNDTMKNVFLENAEIKSGAQERVYKYIASIK